MNRLLDRQSLFGSEENRQQIATVAALAALAEFKTRIFTLGLDSELNKIGDYSTTPIYATQDNYIGLPNRFVGKGKNSNSPNFLNGSLRRSKYYKDGYKEFRADVGRQNETVDLNLTGSCAFSIQFGLTDDGAAFGFTNREEADKLKGNEVRFGATIFEASQNEREEATIAARREIEYLFNQLR